MSKSSNFFGQPIYGQPIKSLDREKIVEISRKHGGEKYVKSFDGYTHLLTMLYAVIQRFDTLREIETSMTAEVRKLQIWVTLIANLLLSVLQSQLNRRCSFSGLATIVQSR